MSGGNFAYVTDMCWPGGAHLSSRQTCWPRYLPATPRHGTPRWRQLAGRPPARAAGGCIARKQAGEGQPAAERAAPPPARGCAPRAKPEGSRLELSSVACAVSCSVRACLVHRNASASLSRPLRPGRFSLQPLHPRPIRCSLPGLETVFESARPDPSSGAVRLPMRRTAQHTTLLVALRAGGCRLSLIARALPLRLANPRGIISEKGQATPTILLRQGHLAQ